MRAPRPRRPGVLTGVVVGALAAGLLAGCAEERPEVPVPASSLTPTAEPTASATATPQPSGLTSVPEFCEDVATAGEVVRIVGVPIPRGMERLYHDDVLPSGRTGRLVCTYGTESSGEEPAVVITMSSWESPEVAQARLDSTVADVGGTVVETTVAGRPGVMLTGDGVTSYAVVDGQVTMLVSLRSNLLPGPARRVVLSQISSLALDVDQAPGGRP